MNAYVVGSSALFFWRHAAQHGRCLSNRCDCPLSGCAKSAKELHAIDLSAIDFGPGPIRLMVPSTEMRVAHSAYHYSVHTGFLPREAFCGVSPGIYVASPELCLLEASLALPRFVLMELCMELCGKYALLKDMPRGFASRERQLASVKSVARFLEDVSGQNGAGKLASVMRYLADGSRSPMETRMHLLVSLPKRYGGYGISGSSLNARIELTDSERRIARRSHLECDMCWDDERVIVEYDGHDDHESRENRARDASKRNVLVSKGYTVYTLTGRQICNAAEFDAFARDLARRLGYRLKGFPHDWAKRRDELREMLFRSLSRYEADRFF